MGRCESALLMHVRCWIHTDRDRRLRAEERAQWEAIHKPVDPRSDLQHRDVCSPLSEKRRDEHYLRVHWITNLVKMLSSGFRERLSLKYKVEYSKGRNLKPISGF